MLAARPRPAAGRARNAWPRHGRAGRQGADGGEGGGQETRLSVWRVQDDHTERGRSGSLRASQPGERLAADDPNALARQVRTPEIRGDDRGRTLVPLDERRVRGAT